MESVIKSSYQIKSEPDGDTADFYFFPCDFPGFFFSVSPPSPPPSFFIYLPFPQI